MPKGRPKTLLTPDLLPEIEEAIKSFGRKERALRKLLAMRCAILTTVANAEKEHLVGRAELMRACRAFRQEGEAGLRPRPRPGKKRRLEPEQEQAVKSWVTERRGHGGEMRDWTLKSLAAEIEKAFGVRYSQAGMLKVLKRLGMSWKTGRPSHVKGNQQEREDFKKSSAF